jgi:hypothetical protein
VSTVAQFVLINQHTADEHAALMDDYQQNKHSMPAGLKGQVQYCTCPSGEHGGYFMVEADSPDEALALLDVFPKTKATTRAVPGMAFPL